MVAVEKELIVKRSFGSTCTFFHFCFGRCVFVGTDDAMAPKLLSLEETQAMRTSQKIGMRVFFSGVSHHN